MSFRAGIATMLTLFAANGFALDPPVKTLLLVGSGGSHKPDQFVDYLRHHLPAAGLRVTRDVNDLSAANLAAVDVVAIFKDDGELPPAAEASLVAAIEGGKGLLALHCSSHCFRNSRRYGELVGGRFLRHGHARFPVRVIDANHPITKDRRGFEILDESYVHSDLAEDNRVLMVRDEGDAYEPMTWVREVRKGRVFYTALGHDERAWASPGWIELVERGLLWAAKRLPENHAPTVGENPPPLSPEESMRRMTLPEGFRVELFAAEPHIKKPITMTFDDRGRLYVAESVDYPNDVLPEGKGNDKITCVEDTDGDGKADRFTTFADKLNIPTSLLPHRGGLLVAHAPDILFLKDNDGDGKADERRVVLTGFRRPDTHAVHSNLRHGFDNWVWATIGYSGASVKAGASKSDFTTCVFRFKPDGSALEVLAPTKSNTWGLGFSEAGHAFVSKANDDHSLHLAIPNRYFEKVRGWYGVGIESIADHKQFHLIGKDLRQVDFHGGYTAAAGQTVYTARSFPREFRDRAAFVCEPTGHLVHVDWLTPKGSGFVARDGFNLLASEDPWTAPIETHVGPDGAAWMIDWYNYIVRHNPTPPGFKTGVGNAYVTNQRDKTRGRVYRIVYGDNRPSKPLSFEAGDLLADLGNDNLWRRQRAQRLLIERGDKSVAPALRERIEMDDGLAALHSLGALDGLGLLGAENGAALQAASRHASPAVRKRAVELAPAAPTAFDAARLSALLADSDAFVRLATLLAISDLPPNRAIADALATVLDRENNAKDRWIPTALVPAAAVNNTAFLAAVAKRPKAASTSLTTVVRAVAEHVARGEANDTVGPLLASFATADPLLARALIDGLLAGWPAKRRPAVNPALLQSLDTLFEKLPREGRLALARLARRWEVGDSFERRLKELEATLRARVGDSAIPEAERVLAARELTEAGADDETLSSILAAVTPLSSPELAQGLIGALGESVSPRVGSMLVKRWNALTPAQRKPALTVLFRRPIWTMSLVEGLESRAIDPTDLAVDQTQQLRFHPDKLLAGRAKRVMDRVAPPQGARKEILERLLPLAEKQGDVTLGKAVFEKNCAKCHRHGGLGQSVGPDLTGVAVRPKREVLADVLDPNRSVEGNFRQFTLATTDGRLLTGILAAETKAAVELIDAEGKRHVVLRGDIDALSGTGLSLMPEGFEKLTAEELTGLLAFLGQRGKFLPIPLGKAATIACDRGMFYDEAHAGEAIKLATWGPREVFGVPFQLIDPREGRVPNAILLHGPLGDVSRKMPKSTRLACNASARTIHLLGAVSGWGYPLGRKDSVSLVVRIIYEGGEWEDHSLKNGEHLADYIQRVDVPSSRFAFESNGRQVRYLSLAPSRTTPIAAIEFRKGADDTAPFMLAVTIESP